MLHRPTRRAHTGGIPTTWVNTLMDFGVRLLSVILTHRSSTTKNSSSPSLTGITKRCPTSFTNTSPQTVKLKMVPHLRLVEPSSTQERMSLSMSSQAQPIWSASFALLHSRVMDGSLMGIIKPLLRLTVYTLYPSSPLLQARTFALLLVRGSPSSSELKMIPAKTMPSSTFRTPTCCSSTKESHNLRQIIL